MKSDRRSDKFSGTGKCSGFGRVGSFIPKGYYLIVGVYEKNVFAKNIGFHPIVFFIRYNIKRTTCL